MIRAISLISVKVMYPRGNSPHHLDAAGFEERQPPRLRQHVRPVFADASDLTGRLRGPDLIITN